MRVPLRYFGVRILGTQRWIRLGIRFKFWTILSQGTFSVPFFGYVYEGDLNDYIDKQVFLFGSYEHDELCYMKKFLHPDTVVLDIGCNTGHHSLFFSRFVKRVHAFDPYKKVTSKLKMRIVQNNIQNISVHEVGLGDKNASLRYCPPLGENQGVGSFVREGGSFSATIILPIKNADTYVATLGSQHIGFIKIDAEGYEPEVLHGLVQTIRKHRPVVYLEFNEKNRFGSREKLAAFFPENYVPRMIRANRPFLSIFNDPRIRPVAFDFDYPAGENVFFIPRERITDF